MRQARCILVIAEDPDRLMLISAALHRKFPNAVVQTCRDGDAALQAVERQKLDAIVALRSTDLDELPLVESLRRMSAVPILLLGTAEHRKLAVSAGASRFLEREGWLLVGKVVAEMIRAREQ
jgi:DNA-binding response OmpR family regulator